MNSGYNPILFKPSSVANVQMQSQQPPFYFGGSQVQDALGYKPVVKPVTVAPKPKKIVKDTITLN